MSHSEVFISNPSSRTIPHGNTIKTSPILSADTDHVFYFFYAVGRLPPSLISILSPFLLSHCCQGQPEERVEYNKAITWSSGEFIRCERMPVLVSCLFFLKPTNNNNKKKTHLQVEEGWGWEGHTHTRGVNEVTVGRLTANSAWIFNQL